MPTASMAGERHKTWPLSHGQGPDIFMNGLCM